MAKAKKATKKATKKRTASKKTTTKKKVGKRAKKEGLRTPQVRILKALATGKALTRAQISEKGNVDLAMLNSYIGAYNESIREKNDKICKSLRTLGYIKVEQHDVKGKDTIFHSITASGKKALTKI